MSKRSPSHVCGRRTGGLRVKTKRRGKNARCSRSLSENTRASIRVAKPLRSFQGRHGVVKLESRAVMSSPKNDQHTVLEREQTPAAQVVVEAHFSRKPSLAIKVLIIVVGLLVGLTILAALIWCLWKAGFFKRASQKNKDEEEKLKRDSWDYVPKRGVRGESTS